MQGILDDETEEYIMRRCQKALQESKEYLEMELSGECSQDDLQAFAEILCYKQCLKDVMAIRNI